MNNLRLFISLLGNNTLPILICLACLSAISTKTQAQQTNSSQVVVSYSYNLAKNIQWPQEQLLKNFTIALYEVSDRAIVNEFQKLNNRITLKNAPVRIIQTRNRQALLSSNMIYLGNNEKLEQVQKIVGSKPILIITTEAENKRLVMINLYKDNNQALKFEVNTANLIFNNLKPLPELILLGGTEIDVAKLYREGQASLINLQGQLDSQQLKLSQLQQQNNTQKTSNEKLLQQMQSLNQDIGKIKELNASLLQERDILNITIESNKTLIAQSEEKQAQLIKQVEKRNTELQEKENQLKIKQEELSKISLSITNKESRLSTLNSTIDQQQIALDKQQAELETQKSSIKELDKLVNTQRLSLYFMVALAIATTALLFLGVFAYKMKRDDNERLARRGQALQVARDKLEIAKRKAEAANRAKGAFLSLMSHELRTPLQSIIGYTDLVIEDLKAEGDTIYCDQLIKVNSNGERLLELINNTLDLAKIEAGKMSVQLTPTHVTSLVEEAISNIKPLLAKNNNGLEIDVDDDSHMPTIDHDKMLHMMVNLLSNATKFTKNGTVTLSIRNQPNLFKLIVSDTGIGLTDKQKHEIFTRFHQVNEGESRKYQGTGLGLSITQYFCEIMGGSIRAEDRINLGSATDKTENNQAEKGSSFIVEIPLPVVIVEKKFIGIDEDEIEGEETAAA